MRMFLNYAAEAVLAADGERSHCSSHAAIKVQGTMQEQEHNVVEHDGTTNGALYAVVPAVASR